MAARPYGFDSRSRYILYEGIFYMKFLKDIFMFWIPMLFMFTLIIFLFILMIAFSLIGVYYVYDWLNWVGLIKSYPFSSGVVG